MKLKLTKIESSPVEWRTPTKNDKSVYDGQSDNEIWSAFKAGDEKALSYIYKTYAEALFNFGYQLTSDIGLIKDAIQNIFITFHKNRTDLTDVISIKSYLYKSLYRELLKHFEKRKRFSFSSNEWEKAFEIEISLETKIIQEEINQEKQEKLQKVLNQLTFKQKKALLLFYEEELSYREVAEVMNLSNAKQARKLVYRALNTARREFTQTNGTWIFSYNIILGFFFMLCG